MAGFHSPTTWTPLTRRNASPRPQILYSEIANRCPLSSMYRAGGFISYSNEGNEPMHVHAVKGEAECKYWLQAGPFRYCRGFLNTTARRVCGVKCDRSSSNISISSLLPGGNILEGIVQSRTKPILAKAIETTPEALVVRLAHASRSVTKAVETGATRQISQTASAKLTAALIPQTPSADSANQGKTGASARC